MKQDNPFAKLGALDQKLYQETSPKQEVPVSRKQDVQVVGITENQQLPQPSKEEDKAFKVVKYQSADQSVDQSINQSTSQSTSQSTK
jgi:hypothetical protein